MKKTFFVIFFVITLLIISNKLIYASSGTTYFYGEPIKIEDENINIVSNEEIIDLTQSKIKNTVMLENNTSENIITEIIIPLENTELSTTIHNLEILIDNVKVNYEKNYKGEYIVKTKIYANMGKQIKINYETDNNLKNAKIIKYNLENLKNKTVGKIKVDIIIEEKDIPLIQGIYPGHYNFHNNTISVEYYNLRVNTLTKDIIVKKETYNNLLYGRETSVSVDDKTVLQNVDKWISTGININYDETMNGEDKSIDKISVIERLLRNNYNISESCTNIIDYIIYKQIIKDNKGALILEKSYKAPLVKDMINEYMSKKDIPDGLGMQDLTGKEAFGKELYGKIVCIDFVETLEGKKLFVQKNINGGDSEAGIYEFRQANEIDILKTNVDKIHSVGDRGARIIYIGEGIDGERLKVTEEEKIQYINSINADMYIRIEIYNGNVNFVTDIFEDASGKQVATKYYRGGRLGYFRDSDYEIAKIFSNSERFDIPDEELLVKLSNEYIANECKIPAVTQYIGFCTYENNRNIVNYFDDAGFYNRAMIGLITTNKALQTTEAKRLVSENRQNNEKIKNEVLSRINNLTLANDEKNIQAEVNNKNTDLIPVENNKNEATKKLNKKEILILLGFGTGVIFCIILIIIINKKRYY